MKSSPHHISGRNGPSRISLVRVELENTEHVLLLLHYFYQCSLPGREKKCGGVNVGGAVILFSVHVHCCDTCLATEESSVS